MPDDAELLRQYATERSETAFAELVRRHLDFVYGTALRQVGGDAHFAADVCQYVFTAVANRADSLASHRALKGWLYTTAHHGSARIVRAERRRQAHELEAHTMHELASAPAANDARDLQPLLDRGLAALAARDREAIFLRFFEDRDYAEIGARYAITDGAARLRIERALEKMRGALARLGVSSTTAALTGALSTQAAVVAPAGLAATISGGALMAAAATAPTIGVISFMTAQKSAASVGMAALLGLLSVWVGVHQWQKSQDTHVALAAALQRYEAGERRLQALVSRSEVAESTLADLQREAGLQRAVSPAPRPAVPAPVNPVAGTVNGKADWERFAAAYPEARAIMIEKYRDQLRMGNRLFFLQAGLAPAQIEELLTRAASFLVENRLGITPNMDLPVEAGLVQFANREDLLRTVMSDAQVQQAKEFLRMGALGSWMNDVRASTIFAGAPLSASQELQLAQVIANSSPAYRNGGNWNRNSMNWPTAYAQAKTVLSPSQWKAAESSFLMLEYRQALDQVRQNQGAIVPVGPIEK